MPLNNSVLKIAVVTDPLENINIKKDSTLAMIEAAFELGHEVYVIYQKNLFIEDGKSYAQAQKLSISMDKIPWYELGAMQLVELTYFQTILMRKDPPFNMEYIYSTYVLELAEKAGVLVLNRPTALRDANEKAFIAHFPECITPTFFSRNKTLLKNFINKHKKVVLKPLDGMGGRSIFVTSFDDPNLNVIIETLTQNEGQMITAQKFIPEISAGDKRILLIDGEPVEYGLARIPGEGDARGNLAVGGKGVLFELSKKDRRLCEQVGPTLKKMGLWFVGLDVIGDYITEINVTSPTCIREIQAGSGIEVAKILMQNLQQKITRQNESFTM